MGHMYGQGGTRVWDTWAMGYRGMGHISNGVQGAWVWGTCMGNEVQGYGAHGQWGTGAMGHIGNGAQSAMGTGGMGTWAIGHMEQ